MIRSPKEQALDRRVLHGLEGKVREAAAALIDDPEVKALQDYANTVSIRRLRYNDHGPVHMKTVTIYAMAMVDLLTRAGVAMSLEAEEAGSAEDSAVAVLVAALLHDVGMTVGRESHERTGVWLALPLIDRILADLYPDDLLRRVILRSLTVEGIVGHMATQRIHSLEAGVVLVADGCDMAKGRARIPMMLATGSRVGDIHKVSAAAVERVTVAEGEDRPIRILVDMNASAGLFQVEEVLLTKIDASPIKPHVELVAVVKGEEARRYL